MSRALTFVVALLALAAPLAAQDRGREADARARWGQKSAAERAELERRFEQLQKMDAAERRRLEERMSRLREWKRRAKDRLPAEMRTQIDRLAPAKREEIVTELAREDATQRGRDLRERMPAEVREKLERASPGERERILRDYKKRNRGEHLERAIERLGEELSLSDQEVRRIKALPPEQREAELLALARRAAQHRIDRRGLPDWMTEAEWRELQQLPPREFQERMQAARRAAGVGGGLRGLFREGDRRESEGRAGPARGRLTGSDRARKLAAAMRPDPSWRLELKDLTPAERRAEVERRVKQRLLEFLEQNEGVVTPEELERLRGLTGREIGDELRGKVRERAKDSDARQPGRPGPKKRPEGRGDGRGPVRRDGGR
jgi:hypothetical protein